MYRDLKLRGSIIKDKQLVTLPLEQIYSKVRAFELIALALVHARTRRRISSLDLLAIEERYGTTNGVDKVCAQHKINARQATQRVSTAGLVLYMF